MVMKEGWDAISIKLGYAGCFKVQRYRTIYCFYVVSPLYLQGIFLINKQSFRELCYFFVQLKMQQSYRYKIEVFRYRVKLHSILGTQLCRKVIIDPFIDFFCRFQWRDQFFLVTYTINYLLNLKIVLNLRFNRLHISRNLRFKIVRATTLQSMQGFNRIQTYIQGRAFYLKKSGFGQLFYCHLNIIFQTSCILKKNNGT